MANNSSLPSWMWPHSAYLHIPFCAHHCGYCDFAVSTGQDHLIDLYVEAITEEMTRLGSSMPVDTIFIGGGTPTYLRPFVLDRFLTAVNQWLPLEASGEFSIEATPESITTETIAVLCEHGVNRVSLGVQSFHSPLLKRLDRIHSPDEIGPAIDRIRRRIPNISLDLIFGIPGQSLAEWDTDLSTALSFSPDHVSTYGLTYEKGTPLWKHRERGDVQAVSDNDELAMYLHAIDRLQAAGFEQYEISNFAKPGYRCRHNETYWANDAYFGFGVGAARFVMGSRELNRRNTNDYIRRVLSGEDPTLQREKLDLEEAARETVAIQLRRSSGIDRAQFQRRTGFDLEKIVGDRADLLRSEGLIEDDGNAIRLTRRGRCVADSLVVKLAWG
jgi:oxygen-independent coproporphyrinogen-3 oxidase